MRNKIQTRLLAVLLMVTMVFLMIPVVPISALELEYTNIDYTPFLIDSSDGKVSYNMQTADMSYDLYIAARDYIDNNATQEITESSSGAFSFTYNGQEYIPESVYAYRPSDWKNTCGALTGIFNFKINDGDDVITKHIAVVAFRGTETWEEIKTDLKFEDENGYHLGFYKAARNHYNAMTNNVEYSLGDGTTISFGDFVAEMKSGNSDYNMIVVGHSLGAAVANIFTSYFLNRQAGICQDNAVAYTYATPCTCSANTYGSFPVGNVFNFINKYDWVPKVGYGGANIGDLYTLSSDEPGYRQGISLRYKAGNSNYTSRVPFSFDNHKMSIYKQLKNDINKDISSFTTNFVLYNNYDVDSNEYQRIVYNNGNLIVSGSGALAGNWNENTLVEWAKVKDSCTSLVFATDCLITEIGDYAFAGMSQLNNELKLPDTVARIGSYAFFHCGFTGALVIPAGMKKVGDNAFNGCSKLDSINAKSATNMTWGDSAFANCVGQYDLLLPTEDSGTDLSEIFTTYYVQDTNGYYMIDIDDSLKGNIVLPGDNVYIGRIEDDKLNERPHYDFHYLLTTGHTDNADNIQSMATYLIENVATVDEGGCVTISDNCPSGTNFTVVVMDNYKGTPDYSAYDSSRFIHFTVGESNNKFAGGIGTEERPYLIKNCDQLTRINDDLSAYYKLSADIDFNGEALTPLGILNGGLDGNGYAIYGFNMSVNSDAGLFVQIAANAYVRNLTLGGNSDTSDYLVTISAGHNESTELIAGGICAINYGTIENCTIRQAEICANRNEDWSNSSKLINIVGGIVGRNYSVVRNCVVEKSYVYANSETTKDNSPAKCYVYSGGIVGINEGTINSCSSLNNQISGYTYSKDKNGALTDWNEGEAQTYCAGLVAHNNNTVGDCYIYENTVNAVSDGDGGEGTDVQKQEDYFAVANQTESGCVEGNVTTTSGITGIKISSAPNKTLYYIGESFNLFGLIVRDSNDDIIERYTVSGFTSNKTGSQLLTVEYVTGYGTFADTFNITVENIIPQTVVVQPKEEYYDIQSTLSADDFTATIYYSNGAVEKMESLAENISNIVKFTAFTNLLDTKGTQIFYLKYHYAYITAEGKAAASESIIIDVAVTVNCECLSTKVVNAKPATEFEYGYTGDRVCLICQSVVEEGTIIDMLKCTDHDYGEWTKYNDTQHVRACSCGENEYATHVWNASVTTKPTHLAAGERTYTCNDCGAIKTETIGPILDHSFSEWINYDEKQHKSVCECGDEKYEEHRWDNGVINDNIITKTCLDCGTIDNHVLTELACISVDSKMAFVGQTVSVNIRLKNNPGVTSMLINVAYDSSILTLTGVKYNSAMGGQSILPENIQTVNGNLVLYWTNGFADYTADDVFATLTFTIAEGASEDDITTIAITYDKADIYNVDGNDISFFCEDGTITFVKHISGDINGDGSVNAKDTTRLMRYLAGWNVEVNENALDVNGDGAVNAKDTTRLMRYLAGWDVDIF